LHRGFDPFCIGHQWIAQRCLTNNHPSRRLRSRHADQFFRPKIGENIRRRTGGVNAIACGYCADETAAARIGLSAPDPKLPAGLQI
jgi:hypothetical protein